MALGLGYEVAKGHGSNVFKKLFFKFWTEFLKKCCFACYCCVIGGKMIYCLSGEMDGCPEQEN